MVTHIFLFSPYILTLVPAATPIYSPLRTRLAHGASCISESIEQVSFSASLHLSPSPISTSHAHSPRYSHTVHSLLTSCDQSSLQPVSEVCYSRRGQSNAIHIRVSKTQAEVIPHISIPPSHTGLFTAHIYHDFSLRFKNLSHNFQLLLLVTARTHHQTANSAPN